MSETETESEEEEEVISSRRNSPQKGGDQVSGWAEERMNYLETELRNVTKRYDTLTSSLMERHGFDAEHLLESQGFPTWIPPTLTTKKNTYHLYEQSRVLRRILNAKRQMEETRANLKREEERIAELRTCLARERQRNLSEMMSTTIATPKPVIPTISPSTHTSPPSRNDFNIDVPQAMLIQGQKENERNLFSLNRAPDSNVWCIPGAIPTVTSSKRKRKRRSGSSLSENGGLSRRDQVSVNACVKRLVERVVVLDRMRKRKEMWALEKQRKEEEVVEYYLVVMKVPLVIWIIFIMCRYNLWVMQ